MNMLQLFETLLVDVSQFLVLNFLTDHGAESSFWG